MDQNVGIDGDQVIDWATGAPGERPALTLGDGLVLRLARQDDGVELAAFNATMHADVDLPGPALAAWTDDLFELGHPTFRATRDVTVVEDTSTGRIVSALFLIPQVWSYSGVPIPVGQPELIATHPDYRRRGLVRTQFRVIHEWSRAAGHLWQVISGIPWYYRQFGYTYGLDLRPRPIMWSGNVAPPKPAGLTVRAATSADCAFLAALEADAPSGTMLGPSRGPDGFALELARRHDGLLATEVLIIEGGAAGTPVGFVAHQRRLQDGLVSVRAFEVRRGHDWLTPTTAVVAHLHDWLRRPADRPGRGIRFALPDGHPGMRCVATRLSAGPPGSYGLYVRIPDVVAFVDAITPVLEARLAASPAAAWTGTLRVDLYTGGLELSFDDGRLASVAPWTAPTGATTSTADAGIPVDAFVQLLLGNRPLVDLERTTADCVVDTDAGALLLDVLFPPMPMSTWEFCG